MNGLRKATQEAEKSKHRHKVGAVIVRGGRIIASGHNKVGYTRLLKNRRHESSVCAEQSAIMKLLDKREHGQLIGSTVYVTRVNRLFKAAMAKPCSHCQEIMRAVSIKRCFYTDNNGTVQELRL